MKRFTQDSAKRAVIAVGSARGFVMETAARLGRHTVLSRIIVTAAHCLPYLPPALACAFAYERTYTALLGPLGDTKPSIMAECLFVDHVADIAVLGEPDVQAMSAIVKKEKDLFAFETFIDAAETLRLGNKLTWVLLKSGRTRRGWLLSLDGRWASCTVESFRDGTLWITKATTGIVGGMSGSPILSDDGRAFGVLCTSASIKGEGPTDSGPQPQLSAHLPGWLLQNLRRRQKNHLNHKRPCQR